MRTLHRREETPCVKRLGFVFRPLEQMSPGEPRQALDSCERIYVPGLFAARS